MYDVSNPENPTVIGYYDTYISDKNEYGGEGAWTAYPFFASGRVIVSDKSGGLFLLQPTPPPSCCIGIRGDFNGDGTNANVLDLNYCVNRIFRGGALPACLPEGDVNSDGTSTNILDLNFLVNRIFRGGPLPGAC
jgi:hypothetical protein